MSLQPQTFFVGFALAVGWVAFVAVASVLHRRSKGKPIFRPHFDRPLFLETWRSGHSLRSPITRLGGARNCLWVAVNGDSLLVAPHFPFNLMFLPEIYGLEHSIKGDAIRSVDRRTGRLDRNRVRVSVVRAGGGEESFEIPLRDSDGFLRAIEAIRRAS